MKKRKLILFLSGLLILILAICGCSSSGGNGVQSSKYILTVNIIGDGTVNIDGQDISNGEEVEIDKDSTIILEVTPAEDWVFNDWVGDDGEEVVDNEGEWQLLMNGDKEITAIFVEEATIVVNTASVSTAAEITPAGVDSYDNITDAVAAAANGDVIEVAEGTYEENSISINNKNIVIRSTHPLDTTVRNATVIDGGNEGKHVLKFENGAEGRFYGFTVQNGYTGLIITDSSPDIEYNLIQNNTCTSEGAGGIYVGGGNPAIMNNTIFNNQSPYGGGIIIYSASPLVSNNTITANQADDSGGGIYLYDDVADGSSNPEITNNIISENRAESYGNGIYIENLVEGVIGGNIIESNTSTASSSGGGLYIKSSQIEVSNNEIRDNEAFHGGGIYLYDSSSETVNNTISGNTVSHYGGGLYIVGCYDLNSAPLINDNTISGNNAVIHGGGISMDESFPEISDNTISGNSGGNDGGGIHVEDSDPIIYGNNIENNSGSNESNEGKGGGIYINQNNSTVKDANDENWPVGQNKPPNSEPNNTYEGNTHYYNGNHQSNENGADVYFQPK